MSLSKLYEPIPFRLWSEENKEDLDRQFVEEHRIGENTVDCEECGGDGYRTCDLGEEHDCNICDGEGNNILTDEEVLRDFRYQEYNTQVSRDRAKHKRFLDGVGV
jgi:hypothetical protein